MAALSTNRFLYGQLWSLFFQHISA